MSNPLILLKNLSMSFGGGEEVLKSINMSINDKEFLTLLGPSGCGKTTTLRLIGGFERPTSGDVYFNNVRITDLPPYKRAVNTVFQRYALFPHLDVYENIAFGLRFQRIDEKEIKRRVSEMLELVNLEGFEKRDVTVLSGGQQQRVAVARALINEPRVLLLDEPLGALDLKLRKEMQIELKRIQQRLGITFVYVTHDQEEALTMSDTVAVMKDGVIQQIGKPEDVYNEPVNAFVADFIGQSNIIPGVMVKDFLVDFGGARFPCVDKGFGENVPVEVVIRPEDLKIVPTENAKMTGVVESAIFMGVHYEMRVVSGDTHWIVHSTMHEPPGNEVGLNLLPMGIHIMHKSENGNGSGNGGKNEK
jgi:spermidine/putrescine transport system ATP-binding protein